jgi:hypothetical protein
MEGQHAQAVTVSPDYQDFTRSYPLVYAEFASYIKPPLLMKRIAFLKTALTITTPA